MAFPKGSYVVLERPFVLKIRPTSAKPKFPTVLLMSPPIPSNSEGFAALSASEGLQTVLPLVVGLQGAEVLERLGLGVGNVVLAPMDAAVAWELQRDSGLRSP